MPERRNFLLGKGERLTERITPAGRRVDRQSPYTFREAQQRLAPMFETAVDAFDDLPDAACPNDEAVGSLLLNPEYIAKSYYPEKLLRSFDLRAVGSRPTKVVPEKRSKNRQPLEKPTTELFIAGRRASFRKLARAVPQLSADEYSADDLGAVELFNAISGESKIKKIVSHERRIPLEVILHASGFRSDHYILSAFNSYLEQLELEADFDHRLYSGGLCFLRMRAPSRAVASLAEFAFLRVVREMPKLRMFDPNIRSISSAVAPVELPDKAPLASAIRVAIFDGGVPEKSALSKWVKSYDTPGVGTPTPELLRHGQAVTSAALFGHLEPGKPAKRPYAKIDHYRVLDKDSPNDPLELFDVLERIKFGLENGPNYDFINLSIGPQLPIEDDDVHVWTSILDEFLSDGSTLATVAVGNDGELDSALNLNRIQVPSDCVNGISVGACDRIGTNWQRAPYSSVGPGRSPGIVKPDVMAFGGSVVEPYLIVDPSNGKGIAQTSGTSFAAPHTLRLATGIRAHFGSLLNQLAIRTLLIHTTDSKNHPQAEVGWGRVQEKLDDVVICRPGIVRVVYQGELTASKYVRARIPLPAAQLDGMVKITATCCYATAIDSAHPSNYTRSGIETAFRPHDEVYANEDSLHPKSESFLSKAKLYQTEDELRYDAHKWETCLHGQIRKRGSSLKNPALDLHYLSRHEGHADRGVNRIKYALVITVEAPRHTMLYDEVVRTYRNILEPLAPQIQVPVTTNV